MTFFPLNNSNSFEADSVRVEIWEPSKLIVLPIPENTPNANTPMRIGLRLLNNTSVPICYYPYRSIIPKLVTLNKEMMPIEMSISSTDNKVDYLQKIILFLTNAIINLVRKFRIKNVSNIIDCHRINPGMRFIISLNTKLVWHDDLLCFQIPANFSYLNNDSNMFWLFNELAAGFYQLQFSYNTNDAIKSEFDSYVEEVRTAQELSSYQYQPENSFINIHIVQTVSNDDKAIEVNDVQFKIEMPEPTLNVPVLLPGAKTSIKLGIRVTNNTSTPLRFQRLSSLIPILIGDDGKIIEPDCDIMRLWVSEGPLFYSAMPGASAFFVLDSTLSRNFLNQLQLAIPNEAGGFWYFRNLKLGKYQLHFIYETTAPITMHQPEESVSEKFWSGCVVIPFVELNIAR
jgi:hypothetical protein